MRSPEGNGCIERLIRTLKEQLLWVRTFRNAEELRLALLQWRRVYNEHWLIESPRTPHTGSGPREAVFNRHGGMIDVNKVSQESCAIQGLHHSSG